MLIRTIADVVLLSSGQMNTFANHAHFDVLFVGLRLIAMHVSLDGILINAVHAKSRLFLASDVMKGVSDVVGLLIVMCVEVASS